MLERIHEYFRITQNGRCMAGYVYTSHEKVHKDFLQYIQTTRSEIFLHTKLFNRHIENVLRCYIEPSKSKFIKKYQGLGPYLRTSYN